MSASPLAVDVYVAPMRPFAGPAAQGPGDEPMWSPGNIGASQRYLRDFSRIAAGQDTVEGIVSAMLELHGDRDNPRVLWHCARIAVQKRGDEQ